MDIYLYSKSPDASYACTNLADLQAMIAALADPQDPTNAATILRVTSKLPPMTQGDTGEPLNVYSYDDASTVSSWVTDVATSLWAGLGDPVPNGVNAYAITSDFSISGSSRVGTLALNTTELEAALNSVVNHRRNCGNFTLQLRTSVGGVTETVARLQIEVCPTVLSAGATDLDPTVYLTVSDAATSYQAKDADLTSWASVTRASGFDTFTATPSSANLRSLLTDETGTGSAVFATSPTLTTPVLGAATATSITLPNGGNIVNNSTGGVSVNASGTNQVVALVPSGTGTVQIGTDSSSTNAILFRSNSAILDTINSTIQVKRQSGAANASLEFYNSSNTASFRLQSGSASADFYSPGGITFWGGFSAAGLNILSAPPASASATGTAGTIAWDSSYIYVCTATNTWKRVAIATW